MFESYYSHLSKTTDRRAFLNNCSCLEPAHSSPKLLLNNSGCKEGKIQEALSQVSASQILNYTFTEKTSQNHGVRFFDEKTRVKLVKQNTFTSSSYSDKNSKLWKYNKEMKKCHSKSGERDKNAKYPIPDSRATTQLSTSAGGKVVRRHKRSKNVAPSQQKVMMSRHDPAKEI
eukprot:CAMPEP_0197017202 /NCGR_PEP_ID=MMETSP1380-20130617/79414_1 /TAXON_ID=5936 /ORGANISM="Euplotes crassus, Strain CT5" /LENGTH=172 /DNA_ID=CAMNT_0042444279 /DNA_START=495 /DNA_END=1013 /DNA_ORIENTATION=-